MAEEKKEKTNSEELFRCFICIEMPREAIDYTEELQNQIKKKNLFHGKMTEPENLHLTLKFLGEISEGQIEDVKKKLKSFEFKSFEASLGELGFFSEKMIRILWMKINGKQIWELQKTIDGALSDIFPEEERFMSHLTIARIKKVHDKKEFLNYIKNIKTKSIKFKVSEFVLKKSELQPEGPVYSDIERCKLE